MKPAVKYKTGWTAPKDVDAYIAAAPKAVQRMLSQLRKVIKSAAPDAKERISYGMPSYEHHGRLAHFAGYESQSTLRFPVGQRLPLALIRKLVEARVKQNEVGKQ